MDSTFYWKHAQKRYEHLKKTVVHFPLTIRIGGSGEGACPVNAPMGPNSFVFTYIFSKMHPCWRSMLPLTSPGPTGNPGSATNKPVIYRGFKDDITLFLSVTDSHVED